MSIPKRRRTKSSRNRRRSHLALEKRVFLACQKCGQTVLPHHVCENCGFYRGREVVNVLAKLEKKEKKNKTKKLAEQEKERQAKAPLSAEELSGKS